MQNAKYLGCNALSGWTTGEVQPKVLMCLATATATHGELYNYQSVWRDSYGGEFMAE